VTKKQRIPLPAVLALICVGALLAIYIGQETLEGLFATGHPAGVAGVFGFGGLWSLPAAACVGLVLAAAFYGAEHVLARVAAHSATRPRAARAPAAPCRPAELARLRLAPVAGGFSDRGPPR